MYFGNGNISSNPKNFACCVRAFRCVTY
jgi:hypothetical protein